MCISVGVPMVAQRDFLLWAMDPLNDSSISSSSSATAASTLLLAGLHRSLASSSLRDSVSRSSQPKRDTRDTRDSLLLARERSMVALRVSLLVVESSSADSRETSATPFDEALSSWSEDDEEEDEDSEHAPELWVPKLRVLTTRLPAKMAFGSVEGGGGSMTWPGMQTLSSSTKPVVTVDCKLSRAPCTMIELMSSRLKTKTDVGSKAFTQHCGPSFPRLRCCVQIKRLA
mmetsp:Transcript_115305/g.288102  ORF Transcript_115305/g.288102 Transcript_115305/m.288102 type:complete len:230 (+) Transcript_115305:603-1292(+)